MSEQIVEIVRSAFEAFARGDIDDAFVHAHPDLVWEAMSDAPDAGTYRGLEEVRGLLEGDWRGTFADLSAEAEEIIQGPHRRALETVLVSIRVRGRGRGSGADVDMRFCLVVTFRDEKAIRVQGFRERPAALEAAGLRG